MTRVRFRKGGGYTRIATESDKRNRPEHVRRVSHVEPVALVPRALFYAIRLIVRDESRAAAWTRRWPVVWQARIFDGPTLGPYDDRSAAIEAEVEWITNNLIKQG